MSDTILFNFKQNVQGNLEERVTDTSKERINFKEKERRKTHYKPVHPEMQNKCLERNYLYSARPKNHVFTTSQSFNYYNNFIISTENRDAGKPTINVNFLKSEINILHLAVWPCLHFFCFVFF